MRLYSLLTKLIGTSAGALIVFPGLFLPTASAVEVSRRYWTEEALFFPEDPHNDICTMSQRSGAQMGVQKMQDVHPQFFHWHVSDEAFISVVSAIDCLWGNPDFQMYDSDKFYLFGSYQIPTPYGLRVWVTVNASDTAANTERFYVLEFGLENLGIIQGDQRYGMVSFCEEAPADMLRSLADEGLDVVQLRDFAVATMPQAHTLAGVDNIDKAELQAAVEAIYAVDEHAVSGEEVTDVIYVTDDDTNKK